MAKGNFFSLETNWGLVLTLFLFMCGCCVYYLYARDLNLDQKIDNKVECTVFNEFKETQEKKHDKNDIRFKEIINRQMETNEKLTRVITILEVGK